MNKGTIALLIPLPILNFSASISHHSTPSTLSSTLTSTLPSTLTSIQTSTQTFTLTSTLTAYDKEQAKTIIVNEVKFILCVKVTVYNYKLFTMAQCKDGLQNS